LRHTLRTPLNQIIGYSELLQEEVFEIGRPEFLGDLQKIHTAGRQLLGQVRSSLDPLKAETGKLDVDALTHDMRTPLSLIIGYSELIQEQGTQVLSPTILADLRRIDTAARNLLSLFEGGKLEQELTQAGTRPPACRTGGRGPSFVARRSPVAVTASAEAPMTGAILVVDDDEMNRDMLSRRLERQGFSVTTAAHGRQALETLREHTFDLVLLDLLMPEMDGAQALEQIKSDPALRHIPVIMLSALDEVDSVVRCLEMGAEDYLPKPFNPVLLRARITASLDNKRLRDQERAYLEQIQLEQEKSEQLLLNVLPKSIADRLRQGENKIADHFLEATVLFADLVDFTRIASHIPPPEVVQVLNEIFSRFDWLAELHRLEKIKTVGDCYMVAAGLPAPRTDHASAMAEMALEMRRVIKSFRTSAGDAFQVRIGMSSGPVVAGIIGSKKFIYDLWGDTVNLASRMESQGQPDMIQVSPSTYERLRDKYVFEKRGLIDIKGKGEMTTYALTGRVGH
jgi:class 3 adenylate cyclase